MIIFAPIGTLRMRARQPEYGRHFQQSLVEHEHLVIISLRHFGLESEPEHYLRDGEPEYEFQG